MSNSIIPFKNREIDYNKKVYVYRNLNCKSEDERYSIMQNGLVVAHGYSFYLHDVEFVVRKSGKINAIIKKKRNVHAFIKGFMGIGEKKSGEYHPVTYDPFSKYGFIYKKNGKQLKKSDAVCFKKNAVLCSKPIFYDEPDVFFKKT